MLKKTRFFYNMIRSGGAANELYVWPLDTLASRLTPVPLSLLRRKNVVMRRLEAEIKTRDKARVKSYALRAAARASEGGNGMKSAEQCEYVHVCVPAPTLPLQLS